MELEMTRRSHGYYVVAAATMLVVCSQVLAQQSATVAPMKGAAPDGSDGCSRAAIHYEKQDLSSREIVTLFEQAAQDKDPRGTMWLARLYFKGRCSLPRSPDTAVDMARGVTNQVMKLAEQGDREAQFLMGSAFYEGLAVDRDYERAFAMYTKAAAAGHLTAMNNLAALYAWGQGAKPDIQKARELFAKAGENGSVFASGNLSGIKDDGRDDTKRLQQLRRVPLVQTLGMQKDEGLAFLVKKGLIADAKAATTSRDGADEKLLFKADGVLVGINGAGRITAVEGMVKGFTQSGRVRSHADVPDDGTGQYKGELPMGLTWEDTAATARQKLGDPDDSGGVASDGAYGMAYRTENVFFAVMFAYDDARSLKIWRVYEKWATDYPAQVATAD